MPQLHTGTRLPSRDERESSTGPKTCQRKREVSQLRLRDVFGEYRRSPGRIEGSRGGLPDCRTCSVPRDMPCNQVRYDSGSLGWGSAHDLTTAHEHGRGRKSLLSCRGLKLQEVCRYHRKSLNGRQSAREGVRRHSPGIHGAVRVTRRPWAAGAAGTVAVAACTGVVILHEGTHGFAGVRLARDRLRP